MEGDRQGARKLDKCASAFNVHTGVGEKHTYGNTVGFGLPGLLDLPGHQIEFFDGEAKVATTRPDEDVNRKVERLQA